MLLAVGASHCGFPNYQFSPAAGGAEAGGAEAGGAEAGGASGRGGTSAGGALPSGGFAGDAPDGGTAGRASAGAGGGTAQPPCVYPAPLVYPSHCFDDKRGDGETGIDCGGGQCASCTTNDACAVDADCASLQCASTKTCVQLLSLQYQSIVSDAFTRTPKFKLVVKYLGPSILPLSGLRIRYYFDHNGVSEPVIALDIQATLQVGAVQMDLGDQVRSIVRRLPLGPPDRRGRKTDSYLELTFDSPSSIASGGTLTLLPDIVAGSAEIPFAQESHYSYSNSGALVPNNTITVHGAAGERLWGVEPPLARIPDCAFATGLNLGGPSVTVMNQTLAASSDAAIDYRGPSYSDSAVKLVPATDAQTKTLLSTAFTLGEDRAAWLVPRGDYWAYAWLTSAASDKVGTLSIQGVTADKFYGAQRGGAAWARLGPYAVSAADGVLSISSAGEVNVAGLLLYRAAK